MIDLLTVGAGAAMALAMLDFYWRRATLVKGCQFTFLMLVLIFFGGLRGVFITLGTDSETATLMSFGLGAARIILLLALLIPIAGGLVMAIVPAWRSAGSILLQRVLRWPESRDFEAARLASGQPGTVVEGPGIRVWTDIDGSRHGLFASTLERMVEATAGATGLPLESRPPLRVLAFDNAAGFEAYGGQLGKAFQNVGGYYMHLPRPTVLVHRAAVEVLRPNLEWVLAHEFAHFLTHQAMGPIQEVWLSEGLAMYLPMLALDRPERSVRPVRILQASIGRGDMPKAQAFLRATQLNMLNLDAKSQELAKRAEATGQISLYYFLSGAFLRYLHRRDAAAFQRFLRGYRRAGATAKHFRACFGVDPARALQEFLEHLEATEPPPLRIPLDDEIERIETALIARLRDPATPLRERLKLLSDYGLIATAWGIDAIIEQLEAAENGFMHAADPERQLSREEAAAIRAEAQRALENTAGGRVAEDAAGWYAWAGQLPPESVGSIPR